MFMRRKRQNVIVALVLILCAPLAAGCAASGAATSSSTVAGGSATYPFDLYLQTELYKVHTAKNKLTAQCLAKAGYPELLSHRRYPAEPAELLLDVELFPRRTTQEALRLGFGRSLPAESPSLVSFDAGFDRVQDTCVKEAQARLNVDDKLIGSYVALVDQLHNERMAKLADVIRREESQAVGCLAKAKYAPDNRDKYLSDLNPVHFGIPLGHLTENSVEWQPKRRPGTIEFGPSIPKREYVPTKEESQLAAALVRCRASVGFFTEVDKANRAVQAEIVAKYEATFTELNPRIKNAARVAMKTLAR